MIAKVFHYLQEEYNFIDKKILDFCDLSPLACVKKRTVNAVGIISLDTLRRIIREEKLLKLPSLDPNNIGDEVSYFTDIKLYKFVTDIDR